MEQIPIRTLNQNSASAVTPPAVVGPIPMPSAKAESGADAGELLAVMRDEERC